VIELDETDFSGLHRLGEECSVKRVSSGHGSSGQGTSGQGTSGQGTSGQGTSGQGTSGQGTSGQGSSGQGTSGQGTSGQGSSGQGSSGQSGGGGGGDSDEDDDEEESSNHEEVPTSNPSSPSESAEGNWKSFSSLMSETFPIKSKAVYLAAYSQFEQFLKSESKWVPNVCPDEVSMLNYFHYLKTKKKWVSTSIWSTYSRINAVLKRKFGVSMKDYPRIQDLLKSFEFGHRVKKSSVFTPQQALIII
jgi:hypothetical protein